MGIIYKKKIPKRRGWVFFSCYLAKEFWSAHKDCADKVKKPADN